MISSIQEYNALNNIKFMSNYSNYDPVSNPDLASFINNTYDTMSDTDIISSVAKCIPSQYMRGMLLKYELEHYVPNKLEYVSLYEIKPLVQNILFKYTWKAGGFSIEDNEWLVYDHTTTCHTVKEYELLFTNTISISECYSDETCEFMHLLVTRLNNLANNIKVNLIYKDYAKVTILKLYVKDITVRKHKKAKSIKL